MCQFEVKPRQKLPRINIIVISFILFTMLSCGQSKIKTPPNATNMFDNFISKEKFIEDSTFFYPGISDKNLKPILTELINKSATDFKKLSSKGETTEKEYQNAIKTGLNRFSKLYIKLDTEDRERICTYYEELMDIVGLESSGGYLNDFMYR